MQRRACLPLAGAVFAVLLCAVGLEGEAQAQFGPPTVANVNPNTGPMQGGTSVTITGTNFSDVTAVRFGSNAAGSFIVNSTTQITATSPAGIGTVDVTVTTPGGTSATSTADQFTYVPAPALAPTVTNINPKYRSDVGGQQCNHHRHQFFRRDCGQVRQQCGRLFHRRQRKPNHRDLTNWGRYR